MILCICCSFANSVNAQQVDTAKLRTQAQIALNMGNIDDAIDRYKKLLTAEPQRCENYYKLGDAYGKKGDIKSLENALDCFKKSQLLDSCKENEDNTQATIDSLDYILEIAHAKAEQSQQDALKEEARKQFLQGRWTSTQNGEYKEGYIIFDVKIIKDSIQINITPSSSIYSKHFINKTSFANFKNGKLNFSFTEDEYYVPTQAKYNLTDSAIGIAADAANNQTERTEVDIAIKGGAAFLKYLNETKKEKDRAKNRQKTYDLILDIEPDENNELNCTVRFIDTEKTDPQKKVHSDNMLLLNFRKVASNR